ncbi:MAG: HAD-IA family hydrolase, partial [Candidatus Omnitrophota bacterium]
LKNNYKLAMVSNINVLHFEYLLDKFSVFGQFSHIITSFEEGVRKPNPKIYQKVLCALGVRAEEVFYADDRLELVQGAMGLGIRGFVFTDALQLEKDLSSVGIKINSDAKIK